MIANERVVRVPGEAGDAKAGHIVFGLRWRHPATRGQILTVRTASTLEPRHREIDRTLQIPHDVMKPVRTWSTPHAS